MSKTKKAVHSKFYCSENNECNYYEIVPLKQEFLYRIQSLLQDIVNIFNEVAIG